MIWDQVGDVEREHLVAVIVEALPGSGVPRHLRDGLVRYFREGILPGGFMQAVLCNDLRQAVLRANPGGARMVLALIDFLEHYAPPMAWGTPERVLAWTTTPGRFEIW